MARIIKAIEIEGQQATALFDTGALYTYARSYLVTDVPRIAVPNPPRVTLGGEIIEIQELCFIRGKIEGLDFVAEVVPVAELGQADGHELDVIIGALAPWSSGRLDSTRGPARLTLRLAQGRLGGTQAARIHRILDPVLWSFVHWSLERSSLCIEITPLPSWCRRTTKRP